MLLDLSCAPLYDGVGTRSMTVFAPSSLLAFRDGLVADETKAIHTV